MPNDGGGKIIPFPTPEERVARTASGKHDAYNLDPAFERALVYALATRPKLWVRLGAYMDPNALTQVPCRHVVQTIRSIVLEEGVPPSKLPQVFQRMARTQDEGRMTYGERQAARAMLEQVLLDEDPLDDVALVSALRPILQRRINKAGTLAAVSAVGDRADMQPAQDLFSLAQRVGEESAVINDVGMNVGALAYIDEVAALSKLRTGLLELDDALGGGLPRGCAGMFVAVAGGSKSMALTQVAVAGALEGLFVLYVTLELPTSVVLARLLANLTNTPIDVVLRGGAERARLENALATHDGWLRGQCKVTTLAMEPRGTTTTQLFEAVEQLEQKHGKKIDLIVVDYADKMLPKAGVGKEDTRGYVAQADVYEQLRLYVEKSSRRLWTASQATRGQKGRKVLGLDDIADSMGKARTADLVVMINADKEAEQVSFFVAKNRHARDSLSVGPLPTDFACARIAPVCVELYPFRR